MIVGAALVAAALTFSGGEPGDLAEVVAHWSKKPVVVLLQADRAWSGAAGNTAALGPEWKPARKIKPFEMSLMGVNSAEDAKDFVRLLRVKTGIESSARGGGIAIWEPDWRPTTTSPLPLGTIALPSGWSVANSESLSVKLGKASFALRARRATRVSDVVALPWSRPVRVHWLLERMWVVPAAQSVPERAFLETLAKAVSGRLTVTDTVYRIDLDLQAFRLRAIAAIAARSSKNPLDRLGAATDRVATIAWELIDDETIQLVFSKPSFMVARPVAKGSRLDVALQRYLEEYRNWTLHPPKGMMNDILIYRDQLGRIDRDRQPKIAFGQNLAASGAWPRVGGGTIFL